MKQRFLNHTRNTSPHPESGVVMIMTLILLAVMTIGTALAMKISLTSDMVGTNLRSRTLAFQSAEIALRYCEDKVIANPLTTRMLVGYKASADNAEWMNPKAWEQAGIDIPLSEIALPRTVTKVPQCLIRHFTIDEWRKIAPPVPGTVTAESRGFNAENFSFYRITARGYSPDYQPPITPEDIQTTVGAEVRLQSMVRAIQ